MALMTPILTSVESFDATVGTKVSFTVTSGDQVVKNRLTIRKNSNNQIVYQNTVETFEFTHTIPANTLVNGEYYNCYINTYNVNDLISENSNVVQFYCLTQPTLVFTNITNGQTLDTASYNFILQYDQSQSELLNELYLYLYDEHNNLLQTSSLITSSFTPPLMLNYTFNALEDNKIYHIQAKATTLNGLKVSTPLIEFSIQYTYVSGFFKIELNNLCNDGCIEAKSHFIIIDGINDGGILSNSTIILENSASVEWNDGFDFHSNRFIKEKWWFPVLRGKINVMSSADGRNRLEIEYKRGIPQGETIPKDYIILCGYRDNVKYFQKKSNYLPMQNNNSNLVSWVKIDENIIDVQLELISESVDSEITWNGNSNVVYERITDLYFNDDLSSEPIVDNDFGDSIDNFNITDVKLTNSVVDHFFVTINTQQEYSTEIPTWDNYTVMSAYFENSTSAGNVDFTLDMVNHIKIKRREVGQLDWITIVNKIVNTVDDLSFTVKDYFIPSGKHFEYALVPCKDSKEYDYYTLDVVSNFIGIFVSDLDDSMKLFSGVSYPQDNYTQDIGILKPFNQVYPIIIQNAKTKFRSLVVSGDILDNNYGFNPNEINDIKDKWIAFLTNGRIKFIKDWNGDIIMGKVTTPPSFTYKNNTSMIIPTISFTLTEQGKYNNIDDLRRNGYLD